MQVILLPLIIVIFLIMIKIFDIYLNIVAKLLLSFILVLVFVLFLVCIVDAKTPAYKKHSVLNAKMGVNYYDDGFGDGPHKETYYNLPMKRVCEIAKSKGVKGEYWETDDGLKMYGYFIICAANYDKHAYGSIVLTSLGPGKVLDTGAFAESNPTQVDIATCW